MEAHQLAALKAALAGRYAVGREIGRGGMAIVFMATDLKNRRPVAIKTLKPEVGTLVGPDRFVREIEIVANLTHPHILPLHDSGEADGFLYYVMPYIEGKSLRQRLQRERRLPLEVALRITREVADALNYAHTHGILHRDIKPGNVLFQAEHALVADFGIARAVSEAAGESLTASGLAVGTPGYTSPEQALGERALDARSDVYSLSCVLYEMLAGRGPFTGQSPQAILAKQIIEPPPSIRAAVREVPRGVDHAIRRGLEREREDRFPTVGAFVEALDTAEGVTPASLKDAFYGPRTRPVARVLGGALAAISLAAVLWIALGPVSGGSVAGTPADTSRYAIFPFEYERVATPLHEVQRLHDALLRWSGVSVADPFQVGEVLAQVEGPLTHQRALDVALQLGAGRYLMGSASHVGDSLWLRAGVYDAVAEGSLLAEHTVRLPPNLSGADSAFVVLADHLLLRGIRLDDTPPPIGTRSLPARQAFARGQEALQAWDLAAADSAFSTAAHLDPNYALAHLWVALARSWRGVDPARWRLPAEQAALRRESLSARDRTMTEAVLAEARGDLGRACPVWRRLTEAHPYDFATWFGRANCQSKDQFVERDATSPSGWSFRTSQHSTLQAYRRAFELRPTILASYRGGSFERLRDLLYVSGNARRTGKALLADTTIAFRADPAWQGDSLAFVPYPEPQTQLRATAEPAALAEAVRRQRLDFRDIASSWVAAFPNSADAMEALAISMAMLADHSGLDTLHRARNLVRDPNERLRVAGSEVWMGVAFALPDDHDRLRGARALADSLLDDHPPRGAADPLLLAGLSALTGRANRAAAYMREPGASEEMGTPSALRSVGPVLLMYAALGGPKDSLAAWEARVRAAVDRSVIRLARSDSATWLAWPATLAFPTYHFESISELAHQDYLLELQTAWAAGDTATVRRSLREIGAMKRQYDPATLSMDGLYPEAWLLAELGDLRAAADWLDPTLAVLPQAAPHALAHPVRGAAMLVRVMALRARLAKRLGDADDAAAWGGAVAILWSDADPFLQPIVKELRRMPY